MISPEKAAKMKLAIAFLVMTLPAVAQTNASAYGYFYAPDGHLALVNIIRIQDGKTVTTGLFYTFCAQANQGLSCQQGDGIIPNSAVTGTVNPNPSAPDVFSVKVDTSAVPSYRNQLCTQGVDSDGDCLGELPATGGLISVSWTRTNDFANLSTSANKNYRLGKLVSSSTSLFDSFSAKQAGTVIGVNAAASAVMATSTDSQSLQNQFAAIKGKKLQ